MSLPNALLAQADIPPPLTPQEKLDQLRAAFQTVSHDSDILTLVVSVAAAIVVVLIVARWIVQLRRRRRDRRPDYLAQAAAVLRLSAEELRAAHWVANRAGVREPLSMLLSPANLAHAIECVGEGRVDPRYKACLERLGSRLFGDSPPAGMDGG